VDPRDGILSFDSNDERVIRLRFNKDIDHRPNNVNYFELRRANGESIDVEVSILSNDAILRLNDQTTVANGERLQVIAHSGIANIKDHVNRPTTGLYELQRHFSTW